jgi:hypothetical protein
MNYEKKYCRQSELPMLVPVEDKWVDLAKTLWSTTKLCKIEIIKAVRVISGDLLLAKKATEIAKVEIDSVNVW